MIRFLALLFFAFFVYGMLTAHIGAAIISLFVAWFVARYGKRLSGN